MKTCPHCGAALADDKARFCPGCGRECPTVKIATAPDKSTPEANPLVGDKNLINDSTIVGRQENYEASNITIHNNISEDHSHMTVVCAVSGKRIYLDQSVVCPDCGRQVALEYYVERSKRCERCEEEAREAFREAAARITAEGPLDAARKQRLDTQAERLHLDADTRTVILKSLKRTPARAAKLGSVQEAELEAAVDRLQRSDSPEERAKALETLAVLHDLTANYTVDCWYFLACAILNPEASVKSYEEELTDNYWQRYWGYLAYFRTGSPKGSVALERVRSSFGEHEEDIRLAEAAYYLARGFESGDEPMIGRAATIAGQIRREYLSEPLIRVYDTLEALQGNDMRPDGEYAPGQNFVLTEIFRAGKYLERLRTERERQEREAHAERERQEQARAAAEQARREREAAMAAERTRRLERELSRAGDAKPGTGAPNAAAKAFAGYQTPVLPEKKGGGWKQAAAIAVGILLLLLIALFFIPAPESLQ